MRVSEAFPSNYLKAADLQGRQVKVTIERVDSEIVGTDPKLVVYFAGKEKGFVLNKTNANNIAAAFGDNTDDWRGAEIILIEAMVDFQGRTVPALRVRIPPRKPAPAQKHAENGRAALGERSAMYDDGTPMDDQIPF